MTKYSKVGNFLISERLIDAAALDRGLEAHLRTGVSLGKALADLGLADEGVVAAAIAKLLHIELLTELPDAPPEVRALLPVAFCRKHLVTPLSLNGKTLRLAMADPADQATIQDVMSRCSKQVAPVVATQTSIVALLNDAGADAAESQLAYERLTGNPEGQVEAVDETDVVNEAELVQETNLTPVVRLVNLILSGAAKEGASDIHIEPKEKFVQVRQRVDGLLEDVFKIPKNLQDATISRLKIISGMDIADRRRPQDGRSALKFEGKRIDLRVSTLPTQFGEKVVIRLLKPQPAGSTMERSDFTPENLQAMQTLLLRRQGMILVTGPTGSGKSSTVYTCLNWVKSPTKNIITVEDPIECQLEGINQVQINAKAGVTFAGGLRSILRQDPNIILVGEIRDSETAGIAFEAAQTGHLLLSTLHTNDATATVSRLLDLGVEPFFVSAALNGVLAQRLVRRPCKACAVPQPPSDAVAKRLGGLDQLPANGQWVAARGCPECKNTGYKGRVAIHELLLMTTELRELIARRAPEHEMRHAARAGGMRTLFEDGLAKAAQGLTTLEALLEVVTPEANEAVSAVEGERVAAIGGDELSTLPAPAALPVPAAVPVPAALPIAATAAAARQDKPCVLVVEDSRTIASVVKYFLELEGFEVRLAADGLIGLDAARNERPHVIVTDVNMPGMDGLTMVKALRADPRTQDIAIAMLTSEESVESEANAFAAGADDYILKPVEPRRLAARVKSLVARSRGRQLAVSA
jgi:type IV pilus assembly protein PilB